MSESHITRSYEITSSYDTDVIRPFRSGISQRNLFLQRTPAGTARTGSSQQHSSHSQSMVQSGFPGVSSEVAGMKTERDREKRDMQDLNERFASYIEKVRFLEAQNKRLGDELDKLKAKWGKESTMIKQMYQTELDEAKRLLEEAEREKSRLEMRLAALEEQFEELRRKLDEGKASLADVREKLERQNQQLCDYEAEANLLRRRAELLEMDKSMDRKIIARLQDSLNRARIDLDNETLLHVDAENRRANLEEELEFLKQLFDQELKDLAAMAYRDTTNENREMWKNEMANALKLLQTTYDDKLDDLRGEMDTYYNVKVQEFRTAGSRQNFDVAHTKEEITRIRTQVNEIRGKLMEQQNKRDQLAQQIDELKRQMEEKENEMEDENGRLRNDVAKLCAEKEGIMKEFDDLSDAKLTLEMEIAAYRKLLEGEGDREGLRQIVDSMVSAWESKSYGGGEGGEGGYSSQYGGWSSSSGGDASMSVRQEVKGQISGKTTYQRSAKGPVAIAEITTDYIVIENTGRKEEDISGWSVKRTIDGSDKLPIGVPQGTVLRPGAKTKLWASGRRPSTAPSSEVEVSESNFGQGKDITTKLLNPSGEDRATHIQKTSYAA